MTLWPRMTISPTSPGGDVVAVVVDDLHLDALDRRADRARLALAVGVVERRHRRGLRQAVALEDLAAERVLEAAHAPRPASPRRRTRTRAGVEASTSSRSRRGAASREYIVGTPSKTVTSSRSMISSALPGSKRGISVSARAGAIAGVQPARLAERVEQRQRAEHDVVLGRCRTASRDDLGVAAQVGVRELGALRRAGGARRVEDHRGVVGRRGRRPRAAARRRPSSSSNSPGSTRMHSAPASSAPGSRGLGEVVPGEQQPWPRSRAR